MGVALDETERSHHPCLQKHRYSPAECMYFYIFFSFGILRLAQFLLQ